MEGTKVRDQAQTQAVHGRLAQPKEGESHHVTLAQGQVAAMVETERRFQPPNRLHSGSRA